MNESDHICANCEFWEKHRDRANSGDCLLNYLSDDCILVTHANHQCQYWMESSVND